MTGLVFDVQRASFVDGAGVRSVVFFKGCNLRCAWCHNPEGISPNKEMLFYKYKCTLCNECKEVCKAKGVDCTLCGECTIYCPNNAKEICGKEYFVDELIDLIERDRGLYESTGGGVTFSGGECMLQIDFLEALLKECKKRGINTAVDTAGNVPFSYFEKILDYVDTFLYDIKCVSEGLHREITGCTNKLILENFKNLVRSVNVIVRVPLISGVNDSEDEILKIATLLKNEKVDRWELLPYHSLGIHKYEALNLNPPKFAPPTNERIEFLKTLF